MKIRGIICPKCKDFLYSRTGHDFRNCSCGSIFIDGGSYNKENDSLGYTRVGFSDIAPDTITNKTIELNVIYPELYEDWNTAKDKYGLIKKDDQLKFNF